MAMWAYSLNLENIPAGYYFGWIFQHTTVAFEVTKDAVYRTIRWKTIYGHVGYYQERAADKAGPLLVNIAISITKEQFDSFPGGVTVIR